MIIFTANAVYAGRFQYFDFDKHKAEFEKMTPKERGALKVKTKKSIEHVNGKYIAKKAGEITAEEARNRCLDNLEGNKPKFNFPLKVNPFHKSYADFMWLDNIDKSFSPIESYKGLVNNVSRLDDYKAWSMQCQYWYPDVCDSSYRDVCLGVSQDFVLEKEKYRKMYSESLMRKNGYEDGYQDGYEDALIGNPAEY